MYEFVPSQHVPASFAFWEKSWHLNIILLTWKLSAANSITHMCMREKNDVWIWSQSLVDAYPHSIKYKLNLMSSQAPLQWHFLFHFSIFLQLSVTLPPFLLFPHYPLPSLRLPRSVFHSKFTPLPPSFSLPSKTTAIPERGPSIFFNETRVRESAKATADYYLSLPPLNTG